MHTATTILASFVLLLSACSGDPAASADGQSGRNKDPGRCRLMNLGEATDAIERPIPDDQLVALDGISNPIILAWQDDRTSKAYYVTRVSGTGARLLYMAEMEIGSTPGALSHFEGTIRLWKNLPSDLTGPMAAAMRAQWDVTVDSGKTWLIQGRVRPDGCPPTQ